MPSDTGIERYARSRASILPRSIASVFGIGYIGRGSGSVAAAVLVALWLWTGAHAWPVGILSVVVVFFLASGIWAAGRVEQGWGPDSERVVVDEFAGMALALFALPGGLVTAIGAFVLFRAFDIVKPLGIARMERLPGGWGVMADDVLAAIYANTIMQLVVRTPVWTWI